MLRVDLREIHRGPMETAGVLQPDDPAFGGLELGLAGPVSVEGRLQETGPGEFFWRGRVRGEVRGGCRRCLADVAQPVDVAPILSALADLHAELASWSVAETMALKAVDAAYGAHDTSVTARASIPRS